MAKVKYNLLKIKNEKELDKVLNSEIRIPVYHTTNPSDNGTIAEGIIRIDEESMREEFENKLADIVNAVANY